MRLKYLQDINSSLRFEVGQRGVTSIVREGAFFLVTVEGQPLEMVQLASCRGVIIPDDRAAKK